MARPESIKDIKREDSFIRIAMFETDKIIGNPVFLKHYTVMLESVNKIGGHADKSYATVELYIPKNDKELAEQLRHDQYYWDEMQKFYNLALNRGPDSDDVPEWRRNSVIQWAKDNDLPNPFDVFAANDPELKKIRDDLGLEDDDNE